MNLIYKFFKPVCMIALISSCNSKQQNMGGAAYIHARNAALNSPYLACNDEPGAAYRDAQDAAENADCHEEE